LLLLTSIEAWPRLSLFSWFPLENKARDSSQESNCQSFQKLPDSTHSYESSLRMRIEHSPLFETIPTSLKFIWSCLLNAKWFSCVGVQFLFS
jgi:hypothetical protein